VVVYVGRLGVQHWVDREVRVALELNMRDPHRFKLIPVFGEGAAVPRMPPFLLQHQGIPTDDPHAIRRLVEALQGDGGRRATSRALGSSRCANVVQTRRRCGCAWSVLIKKFFENVNATECVADEETTRPCMNNNGGRGIKIVRERGSVETLTAERPILAPGQDPPVRQL
jgi:hypothetical protein